MIEKIYEQPDQERVVAIIQEEIKRKKDVNGVEMEI